MAKRKHKGKRRRRSVGALSMKAGSPLLTAAAAAAGFFADQFVGINSMIDGFLPGTISTPAVAATATTPAVPAMNTPTSTMNNIAMVGELGLGTYLVTSKRKSMVKTVAGGVAIGLGARRLAKELKLISGFQDYPVIGRRGVNGFEGVPVIGGLPSQLSGLPAGLSGYVPHHGMGSYSPIGSGSNVLGGVGAGGSGYMQ